MMAIPGKMHRPGRRVDELESLLQHAAPARGGRLLADSEEAQAGLGQQGKTESERQLDDDRRGDVGDDVPRR